jgi:hypothetical protein
MSLFDQLVEDALNNTQDLALLRIVVEKELLHHEILRILSEAALSTDIHWRNMSSRMLWL